MMTLSRAFLLALALPLAAPLAAQEGWNPDHWEMEASDIAPAPGWHFGRLDNGLRYIVRRNTKPEGTVLVRMLVRAGSLDERDEERGFAHYVEHMAFNGSANVPEGEMVKLLEREGLAFGADTNASTGFDATEYKLDLPRNDPALVDTALMLMRETAGELLFDPEAVARERGVVLSERRVRNTYAFQNLMDGLDFVYPDALASERLPIGTLETLQAADAAALKAFWRREYVPADTVLVVVGDIDTAAVEAKIRERFADWEATPSPEQPGGGPVDPADAARTDIYIDPALDETVTLTRNAAWRDRPDTKAERARSVLRGIGEAAINRRPQRLARNENPPFRGAGVNSSDFLEAAQSTTLTIATEQGGWRRGLDAALDEYRRAMIHGFTEAEIAEQVGGLRATLENAAANETTRSNAAWAAQAEALARGNTVPDSAADRLARFEAMVGEITPEAVLAAIREDWSSLEAPLIRFTGKAAPAGGEAALREAVAEGFARSLDPPAETEATEFAYGDFGAPGTVVSDTRHEALGIRTLRFANGVMLNLKPTALENDRIRIELNIDGGQMLMSREEPLAVALTGLLAAGGLGKHGRDELQTILAGRTVGGSINDRTETFGGETVTTPEDFTIQFELLAAYITDPGYRAEGLGAWKQGLPAFYARLGKTPSSAYSEAAARVLSDNDPRFARQPIEAYQALGYADLREVIADRLAHGALEIGIVGDFDEKEAIRLVARTFGALPQREPAFRDYDAGQRARGFTADRGLHVVHHGGEADQALLRFVWPTADDSDWQRSARLELLERVAQIMLTDSLREELGQTYSADASASQSDAYTGYGTFAVGAQIEVGQLDAARKAMIATIEKLRGEPVPADILERARRPLIEAFDNSLKTNSGWLALVDRAQGDSEDIARFLTARERYLAVTSDEIRELAQTYLDPARAVEFRVVPEPKG